MRKKLDSSKYLELPHSRSYQRHCFEEIQHGRTFVDRHYYRVLIESLVNKQDAKFIDIGSGYGQLSFELAKARPDLDIHLLETSKDRLELGIKGFKVALFIV